MKTYVVETITKRGAYFHNFKFSREVEDYCREVKREMPGLMSLAVKVYDNQKGDKLVSYSKIKYGKRGG